MRDITETIEDLGFKVTSEPGIDKDRYVQIAITTPDGVYKTQFEMVEGAVTWVDIPLKLVGGRIVTG
ncbi:hypothetical protein ACTOWA_00325 [Herbaspirillum seropedicae]|uniref:hypothetical protein n=1 Tax=Herbaspirillum seropedicae TaxID=964 RepID=UPI0028640361|nr:hypothetical protein [Herbaspirillum seropedicae]MDR6397965.1 hypothetical protein [Herbaspirillum seropedicae]